MRYQEAYEIIDIGIVSNGIEIPITETLKTIYFDKAVEQIAMRSVLKKNIEEFTTSGKEYIFNNEDYSGQVYKVELDNKDVPFVDEASVISGISDDNISHIGYFLKTDNSRTGIITNVTQSANAVITSTAHGLTTNDYIIISEVKGATEAVTGNDIINGRSNVGTIPSDDQFTLNPAKDTTNGTNAHAYISGGIWELDNKQIHLTKTPSAGKTLKVYYYSKPLKKDSVRSRIDLPDQLIPVAIHETLGHFLNLAGNLQLGTGQMGLAKKIEKDYIETSRAKEPMPHLMPNPMQVFVTDRNGSPENTTGADN